VGIRASVQTEHGNGLQKGRVFPQEKIQQLRAIKHQCYQADKNV
jgi:hypothetical protein